MLWYVDASCCMQLDMGFAPASMQHNITDNVFYYLVFKVDLFLKLPFKLRSKLSALSANKNNLMIEIVISHLGIKIMSILFYFIHFCHCVA